MSTVTSRPAMSAVTRASVIAITSIGAGLSAWFIGGAAAALSGNHNAPWIVGRASGITSYFLLLALVVSGLLLAHPWRTRYRRPRSATRIRIHVALAMFALAFVVLHIVVLATDPYAGVGWIGSLLPFGSQYRPAAVTLGVIGMYAGLLAGGTAMLSSRITARIWWPIHKVAAVTLILVWAHGVWAGNDTPVLAWSYLVTGVA
ncbi:MAG: hypothetical protein WCP28_13445, partial [Actinomycetes bacterium]